MFDFCSFPVQGEIFARINGVSYHGNKHITPNELVYIKLTHYGTDGKEHTGELIVNRLIETKIRDIFCVLHKTKYVIEKMRLVDCYGADDVLSMADNNSSAFNYRVIADTDILSRHALGLAIDINPLYNPYITYIGGKEKCSPVQGLPYCDRTKDFPMKIDRDDLCYKLFTAHGFTWGGDWQNSKDYQHFEYKL